MGTTTLQLNRCGWAENDPLMQAYHDEEWGVALHDDRKLFEYLILDGAQAGLSWRTILYRREGYRQAFAGFDPRRVAQFGPQDVRRLLKDPGIIRNRLKIKSAIQNARAFLEVQAKFKTFDRYIWQFVEGKRIVNHATTYRALPTTSPESDAMSKDLRARGFNFVGSTICYAFMQAAGMVDDHLAGCFRKAG
ncbi:MAG TPA: DNA-3-methyladenine glycosylase I [Elusimicrobiota bacterium]|nr:DNA-3-methyladenine glycosylase I [Elusimicrobiota bacterium]